LLRCVRFGRPDLTQVFEDMAEAATTEREARVAVLFCGPPTMQVGVRRLCAAASTAELSFDFQSEEFEL
jgi:hypothetical protein